MMLPSITNFSHINQPVVRESTSACRSSLKSRHSSALRSPRSRNRCIGGAHRGVEAEARVGKKRNPKSCEALVHRQTQTLTSLLARREGVAKRQRAKGSNATIREEVICYARTNGEAGLGLRNREIDILELALVEARTNVQENPRASWLLMMYPGSRITEPPLGP